MYSYCNNYNNNDNDNHDDDDKVIFCYKIILNADLKADLDNFISL